MNKTSEIQKNKIFLQMTPKLLKILFSELPEEFLTTKLDEEWTPFDVLGHLVHGENDDWIPRTKIILYENDKKFKPFDRTAMLEMSKGKSIQDLLNDFQKKRSENIKIMEELPLDENFDKTGIHPALGVVNLEQLLATWVAHDLTHLYQIIRFCAKPYKAKVGPWIEYLRVLKDL